MKSPLQLIHERLPNLINSLITIFMTESHVQNFHVCILVHFILYYMVQKSFVCAVWKIVMLIVILLCLLVSCWFRSSCLFWSHIRYISEVLICRHALLFIFFCRFVHFRLDLLSWFLISRHTWQGPILFQYCLFKSLDCNRVNFTSFPHKISRVYYWICIIFFPLS